MALDRGYNDCAPFGRWTMAGVYFVTRLKDKAAYAVVEQCQLPANRGILSDQIIRLTHAVSWSGMPATNGKSSC